MSTLSYGDPVLVEVHKQGGEDSPVVMRTWRTRVDEKGEVVGKGWNHTENVSFLAGQVGLTLAKGYAVKHAREMKTPLMIWGHCFHCTVKFPESYMVKDEVWQKANMPLGRRGLLCIACLEMRICRPLVLTDFTDTPMNDVLRFAYKMGAQAASVPEGFEVGFRFDGLSVYDMRDQFWAIVDTDCYWSPKPWSLPSPDKLDEDPAWCEDAIKEGGGTAYSGYLQDTHEVPGGLLVKHDPQVFTGSEWGWFSNDRRVS